MKISAIVPMRHHSQRVRNKNFRCFAGRPLCLHVLTALSKSQWIDEIVVDTDSDEVREIVSKEFPAIRILARPMHLRAPETPMNDVLLNTVQQLDADLVLQTHSTSPLLRTETLDTAVDRFRQLQTSYDSLFSVTRWQTRLYDQLGRAINHNPAILLQTQDLPPVYEENSAFYIFPPATLRTHHSRIGQRPYLFEIPRAEAMDIDTEEDWSVAELYCLARQKRPKGATIERATIPKNDYIHRGQ